MPSVATQHLAAWPTGWADRVLDRKLFDRRRPRQHTLAIEQLDADFCWRPELDVVFGTPVGPPVRTGLCTWARNFTRSIVAINVSAGRAGRWTCFRDAMQRMGTATGLVANTQRHVLYNIVGVFKKVYEMNHDLLILYHPVVRMLRRTCA